jgi:hypothetical protein
MIARIALLALLWQATPGPIPISMGVDLQPDTVTVGDPILLRVRIRAPIGSTIEFPQSIDSSAAIGMLARTVVDGPGDSASVEQIAGYRLAAWDVGSIPIRLADVIVRVGGTERVVPLGTIAVFVKSVLPEDSAKRIPKPPRPLMELPNWNWLWYLVAAIAALILAYFLWRWGRRRRDRPIDPYAAAIAAMERIAAMRLIEQGEEARYTALVADVLRVYLSARVLGVRLSQTTKELLGLLGGPLAAERPRVSALLEYADLAKFARVRPASESAQRAGSEVRTILQSVEQTLRAFEEPKERAA